MHAERRENEQAVLRYFVREKHGVKKEKKKKTIEHDFVVTNIL